MGILDRLSPSSQFIEVIEWLDDSGNTLIYRFPVRDQEIKNGAQLIVRESQAAVFVYEGQIADQFGPGRYTIDGGNTPILSKLGAWKYGFNSPFKAEVYYVNTRQFTDFKWGTKNPIMVRDPEFISTMEKKAEANVDPMLADEFVVPAAGDEASAWRPIRFPPLRVSIA